MGEAVRTYASPAATWTIVVMASSLALFMATAAMAANHFQIREHRRMRKLGIWPAPAAALDADVEAGITSPWPRLSEALFAAAGTRPPAATGAAAWTQAGYTAAGHDFPAQREPAEQLPAAKQAVAAQYAGALEAEPPTEPIPAQRAQGARDMRETPGMQGAGQRQRAGDGSAAETTRPDLLAQEPPGRDAMPLPAQRTGESDRAERSLAGPAPRDDDEDEDEQ